MSYAAHSLHDPGLCSILEAPAVRPVRVGCGEDVSSARLITRSDVQAARARVKTGEPLRFG